MQPLTMNSEDKTVAKSGANGDQIGAKVRIRSAGLGCELGANLYSLPANVH